MTGNKMKISKNLYFDIPNVILIVTTDFVSAPQDIRGQRSQNQFFLIFRSLTLDLNHCFGRQQRSVEQKNSQQIMYNEIYDKTVLEIHITKNRTANLYV